MAIFLHSIEGVTQGEPLAMISYDIGILTLIKNLQRDLPGVNQPWYNDNSISLGAFTIIKTNFNYLPRQVPRADISPNHPKAYLLCIWRIWRLEIFLAHVTGSKVCMVARYFSACIREHHLVNRGRICGSREDGPANVSALFFLQKDKISLTHRRTSNCNTV